MKHLNIRQERIDRGWTLEHIGRQTGLTKTAIHAIETGQNKPSFDVLLNLLKLLNKETAYNEIVELFAVADENNLS